MGELVRRVLDGYQPVLQWSSDDPKSYEAARAKLREEVEGGYMAVREDDGRESPVTDLPADAERVILTMPMGGG